MKKTQAKIAVLCQVNVSVQTFPMLPKNAVLKTVDEQLSTSKEFNPADVNSSAMHPSQQESSSLAFERGRGNSLQPKNRDSVLGIGYQPGEEISYLNIKRGQRYDAKILSRVTNSGYAIRVGKRVFLRNSACLYKKN